ncbi:CIA30 family protein [Thioalkalivibrio sp.]|uniref:CIA30 family protein n=1 Tax=Thioalkalivibrio sp. TaxID=2093813 RepID=UPI003975B6DE
MRLVSLALVAALAILPLSGPLAEDKPMTDTLLLDDFQRDDGLSTFGTRWEGLGDRVMGGRSDMQMGYRDSDTGRVLFLRGQVRLDNGGGFIQARLPLDPAGGSFDATAWQGLRIKIRGAPGPHYLHLRTRQNWLPWQHYRAPIEVGPGWQEQFIPFTAFERRATVRGLDVSALKSVGVVAYGEAFEADVEVGRLEFANW